MEESTVLAILKIVFMVLFFSIVTMVGTIPIRNQAFKTNKFLKSMGTTFAGALFINVSILHILPESADTIEAVMKGDDLDKDVFPLANLLVIVGFLITIFFTRIISTHTHHHDQENHSQRSSFHEQHQQKEAIKEHDQHKEHQKNKDHSNEPRQEEIKSSILNETLLHLEHKESKKSKRQKDAYFLTMAMYFHTIFQGIAIGVQNTTGGFLSTAIAIAFHKWADALSMGIHYRNRNVRRKVAIGLILGQAALNLIAIGIGWLIDSFGELTEAIFLSISAGTFLAISTMQMLGEQLHNRQFKIHKFVILLFSTGLISCVWFLENSIFNNESDT